MDNNRKDLNKFYDYCKNIIINNSKIDKRLLKENINISKYLDDYAKKIVNKKLTEDYDWLEKTLDSSFERKLLNDLDYELENMDYDYFNANISKFLDPYTNFSEDEIDWEEVLKKLKEDFVVNMNYGAPKETYIPMASYRVVSLIDTKNDYSREIRKSARPEDIIVELEKYECDPDGKVKPDRSYKLYIPLAKLVKDDVLRIGADNKRAFKEMFGSGESFDKLVTVTKLIQDRMAKDPKIANEGMKVHEEKSISIDDLDARLVHVEEKIVNGEKKLVSEDITASNTSLAIYGCAVLVKRKEKIKDIDWRDPDGPSTSVGVISYGEPDYSPGFEEPPEIGRGGMIR